MIRIAETYHAFQAGDTGKGYAYIIMEHIKIEFELTALNEEVSDGIRELISFRLSYGIWESNPSRK